MVVIDNGGKVCADSSVICVCGWMIIYMVSVHIGFWLSSLHQLLFGDPGPLLAFEPRYYWCG